MGNKARNAHDSHCRDFSMHPKRYLGNIDGLLLTTDETNIIDEKGIIKTQPDFLIFSIKDHTIYHGEYKSHSSISADNHALRQLKIRQVYLTEAFSNTKYDRIVGLYVHDNNEINIIR